MIRRRTNERSGRGGGWAGLVLDAFQINPELFQVARKRVTGVEVEVEAANHGFVVGADTRGNGPERRSPLSGLFGFQVVVDEDDERKREGFCGEDVHGLFHIVVEYAEVGFLKVGNEFAELILNGDGKN